MPIAKIIRSKSTICNFLVIINSITVAVSLIPFERSLSSILEIAIFAYSMDPSTGGACALRTAFGRAGWGWGSPLQRGYVRVTPYFFENLLSKSCFLASYKRQKVGLSCCAKLYCEMRKTGAALMTTSLSGTRVYRRGTSPGWPPLGAATGTDEPHTI